MTADQIEQFAPECLQALGYARAYSPLIAHDGERPKRASCAQMLLLECMGTAVWRNNPRIPAAPQEKAVTRGQEQTACAAQGYLYGCGMPMTC